LQYSPHEYAPAQKLVRLLNGMGNDTVNHDDIVDLDVEDQNPIDASSN